MAEMIATLNPTRIEIGPQPGPQYDFLASPADVVFYGGAAGGGKSYSLLLEPLRHIHNQNFRAVIFRRTYPQITNPEGLWDTAGKLYPLLGADSNQAELLWKFPSGARIEFAHMQHAKNRFDWQGSGLAFMGWDELPHFERAQFMYMFSRSRSMSGVRPYIRATMNPVPPEDETGGWIHEFVGWYIDKDGWAVPERCGLLRWFVVVDDTLRWADTADELRQDYPALEPKSFTFIKSSVYDNQVLLKQNPEYLANLMALPLVERERLLGDPDRGGNWLVKPTAGKVFNRGWFGIVDAVPAAPNGFPKSVRFWDLAASEKKLAKEDPDYTAGVLMQRVGDLYYVLDCIEEREGPAAIDDLLLNTASQDGKSVAVRWEMEGGASGKRDNRHIAGRLAGYDARGIRPQGDKLTRARALSAQALAGNVKLLRGPWNGRWLTHMHGQPDLAHDDIMDASSGAFNELTPATTRREGGSYQG
jgi:predicted phage terminase large subunit-like protein